MTLISPQHVTNIQHNYVDIIRVLHPATGNFTNVFIIVTKKDII